MRKVWVVVTLVMLVILIYVLHVYIFIEPDTDDMMNESRIAVQEAAEPMYTHPDVLEGQSTPKHQSVTAQSLLDSENNLSTEAVCVDEPVYDSGMFSWENDAYAPQNLASFYLLISMLEINEVYQDFSDATEYDENAAGFARELALTSVSAACSNPSSPGMPRYTEYATASSIASHLMIQPSFEICREEITGLISAIALPVCRYLSPRSCPFSVLIPGYTR